jgi:DNA polymerase I-like protein with 3'-5' exonuclease and polymerase domains
MQVHDELVFDLHKDEQDIVKPKVIELMKIGCYSGCAYGSRSRNW